MPEKMQVYDVPKNSRVAIYGTGLSGKKIRSLLACLRKDVEVVCFISSFENKTIGDIDCFRMTNFDAVSSGIDYILVASVYDEEITKLLQMLAIKNYFVMDSWYNELNIFDDGVIDVSIKEAVDEHYANRRLSQRTNVYSDHIANLRKELVVFENILQGDLLPGGAMVQIVKKCNIRCKFCGWKKWESNTGFMDFALFKKVVDELKGYGAHVTLCGAQGEATLHPKFIDIIQYITDSGVPTHLCTNGTGLTPRKIQCIAESGLESVQVSFAGYDKDSYERIYCGANFERVVGNIKNLSDCIRKNNTKMQFGLGGIFPASSWQYESYDSFEKKCFEFYAQLDLIGTQTLTDHYHNFGGTADMGSSANRHGFPTLSTIGKMAPFCWHIFNPGINFDGIVTACGCHDFNRVMAIGDIKTTTLHNILKSEPVTDIVRAYIERDFDKLPLCKNCDVPFYLKPNSRDVSVYFDMQQKARHNAGE